MFDQKSNLRAMPDQPVDGGSGLPMPPVGYVEEDAGNDDSFADGVDVVARIETAKDRVVEDQPRYVFARIAIVLIMAMWLVSGFAKVSDVSAFIDIVEQHRVVPGDMAGVLMWVGPAELVVGLLLVFAIGSELRKPFGKLVILVSLAGIASLTYYLSLVDPVVLQESGCGCLSDYRIASGMENSVRFFAYAKNTILIILHIVALFGPAMVDSNRRSHA